MKYESLLKPLIIIFSFILFVNQDTNEFHPLELTFMSRKSLLIHRFPITLHCFFLEIYLLKTMELFCPADFWMFLLCTYDVYHTFLSHLLFVEVNSFNSGWMLLTRLL